MLKLIIISVLSYLIGCLPSGYLLVKLFADKNIFKEGTCNNGAANSIDITGSKLIGFFVMIFDFLKAFLPIIIFQSLGFNNLSLIIVGISVLLGHNYNIFFKFKGGRGLSSSAGILIVFAPLLVCIWLISYFSINYKLKNVQLSSVIAVLILTALGLIFDALLTNAFNINLSISEKYLLILSVSTIVLTKHSKLKLGK